MKKIYLHLITLIVSTFKYFCILTALSNFVYAQSAQENKSLEKSNSLPTIPLNTSATIKLNIDTNNVHLLNINPSNDKLKQENKDYIKTLETKIVDYEKAYSEQKSKHENRIKELEIELKENHQIKDINKKLTEQVDLLDKLQKEATQKLTNYSEQLAKAKENSIILEDENQKLIKSYYKSIINKFNTNIVSFANELNNKYNDLKVQKNKLSFWLEHNDDELTNKSTFFKDSSLVILYFENEKALNILESMQKDYKQLEKAISEVDSTNLNNSKAIELENKVLYYEKSLLKKNTELRKIDSDLQQKINVFNQLIKTKKTKSNSKLDAIPNINSFLGQSFITPNISLKGASKFSQSGLAGDIRIFTAASNNNKLPFETLYVPESSPYGISLSANYFINKFTDKELRKQITKDKLKVAETLMDSKNKISKEIDLINKKIGDYNFDTLTTRLKYLQNEKKIIDRKLHKINKGEFITPSIYNRNSYYLYLNANYLGKNFNAVRLNNNISDTVNFTSDIVHFKIGAQGVFINNLLSIYGNINLISSITNRENVIRYYEPLTKGFTNFYDIGIKFYIQLQEEHPLNLFFDTNFIFLNKKTNSILPSKDAIVPSLKIGLLKTF